MPHFLQDKQHSSTVESRVDERTKRRVDEGAKCRIGDGTNGSIDGVDNNRILDLVDRTPAGAKHFLLKNHITNGAITDRLHVMQDHEIKVGCVENRCAASLVKPPIPGYLRTDGNNRPTQQTLKEATDFMQEYYEHTKQGDTEKFHIRKAEVCGSIQRTGTYELTYNELKFGAKTAWRNAPRCIGRIQWKNLELLDARNVDTAEGMYQAICRHLEYATNGGNIRSALTVFRQRQDGKKDLLIWNSQLIRYAGYRQPDGGIIGDPISCEFTQTCEELGWSGKGGMFDVLPLVLQIDGNPPQWFEIPTELVLEVQLTHPKYDWFYDLGLKWYAVPCVADMMLDVGGLQFSTAPFNGWYMGPEIGARNLCDPQRYNLLELIAKRIGLDLTSNISLWKDQALIDVNIAVLHSFKIANVTIIDHHSAAESFMKHMENEQRLRGGCPADWVWIVPPISGSITPVFHQEMISYQMKPAFLYQEPPRMILPGTSGTLNKMPIHKLKTVAIAILYMARVMKIILAHRPKAIIIYATETGKSERYARIIGETFSLAFDTQVICMADYDISRLSHDRFLLVVASTFGNGEPPADGVEFFRTLKKLVACHNNDSNNNMKANGAPYYSVFGLGSTAYPDFCAFACKVDTLLDQFGGHRLLDICKGDELGRQEEVFKQWRQNIFRVACNTFPINRGVDVEAIISKLGSPKATGESNTYRLKISDQQFESDHLDALSKIHGKNVQPCRVIATKNLQSLTSSRSTIQVQLDTHGTDELFYEPGDHAIIFPTNDKELVDQILSTIDYELLADTIVQLESAAGASKNWKLVDRLPPCSVQMALSRYLDITTPPTADVMRMLANYAHDIKDREHMLRLAENERIYKAWVNTHPNLVDVMSTYPSLKVPAWFLMKCLPVLKPRYYSISSSPNIHHNEIHLTLAVVKYWMGEDVRKLHKGVCSSWLDGIKQNEVVPVIIKRSCAFHLPTDISKPVILIGSGTAIAPFRSFWQQRHHSRQLDEVNDEDHGKMLLMFGCRHPDLDDIYREEIQKAFVTGILSRVFTAYSRVPGKPKTYVQDRLVEESALVLKYIHNDEGHFYVCGNNLMAVDVRNALLNVLKTEGHMTSQEAESYVCGMRDSGRYHEDVFGVFRRPNHKQKLRKKEQKSVVSLVSYFDILASSCDETTSNNPYK